MAVVPGLSRAGSQDWAAGTPEVLARVVEGLRRYTPPTEYVQRIAQVQDARCQIQSILRSLAVRPSGYPLTAVAMAEQCLALSPTDPQRPSSRYVRVLRHAVELLEPYRAAAAVYVCVSEAVELAPANERLQRTAETHGGRVRRFHHDRGLCNRAVEQRPGWQRLRHFIDEREISLLVVGAMEELVPADHPWSADLDGEYREWDRWAAQRGMRLIVAARARKEAER